MIQQTSFFIPLLRTLDRDSVFSLIAFCGVLVLISDKLKWFYSILLGVPAWTSPNARIGPEISHIIQQFSCHCFIIFANNKNKLVGGSLQGCLVQC